MEKRNRLKEILSEIGLENLTPSKILLDRLKITRLRFFQILENKGKNEVTVAEKDNIEGWLAEALNKPVAEVLLMENEPNDNILKKHNLS